MVSDVELMRIQVEALYTQNENGRLRDINDPDGDIEPAPRFSSDNPTKVRCAGSDMTSRTI